MSLRPRHNVIPTLLAASLLLGSTASPAGAVGERRPMAILDGRPIPVTRMARLHCHDLDGGTFRCYRTARALTTALARIAGRKEVGTAGVLAVSYIRLYEHEAYDGASIALSQDYPNLGVIGWNDRMSSFKVLNSGSGSMHKDAQYLSGTYAFCCTTQVSNVGSTWNDAVSSIKGEA